MLCDVVELPKEFLESYQIRNSKTKDLVYVDSTFRFPQKSRIWYVEGFDPVNLSSLDKYLGLVEGAGWDTNNYPSLRLGLRHNFDYLYPLDWRFYDETQIKWFLYSVGVTKPSFDSKELTGSLKGFPLYLYFSGYKHKSDYNLSMAGMNLVGISFNKDLVDVIAHHYGVHYNYNLTHLVSCNIPSKTGKKK